MIQVLCGKYDARSLAALVVQKDRNIRDSAEYKESMDWLLDTTMSCDRQEAIDSLISSMSHAIRFGKFTQDRSWRYEFLAAYDICKGL